MFVGLKFGNLCHSGHWLSFAWFLSVARLKSFLYNSKSIMFCSMLCWWYKLRQFVFLSCLRAMFWNMMMIFERSYFRGILLLLLTSKSHWQFRLPLFNFFFLSFNQERMSSFSLVLINIYTVFSPSICFIASTNFVWSHRLCLLGWVFREQFHYQ